ncbi:MAG: VOC family protein, partial [Bryobacteraceae bacterium]
MILSSFGSWELVAASAEPGFSAVESSDRVSYLWMAIGAWFKAKGHAMAKNTICLWYDQDAEAAARFYAATFPDSAVG